MNDTLIHEIVTRFHGGASMRRIAESLHIGRRTVRRVLEQVEQARSAGCQHRSCSDAMPRRGSQLDAYRDRDHRSAVALSRHHGSTDPRGIATARLSGELHAALPAGADLASASWSSNRCGGSRPHPEMQAQMDYSTYDLDFTVEGRRRVYAFSYVLGYSRRQYLHFVESQDFATTIREHIRAFEHLGGVAATCLYDNMKVVVSGYDGDEPIYNPRFPGVRGPLRFSTGGLPRPPAPDQRESGTASSDMSNPACWVAGRSVRWST